MFVCLLLHTDRTVLDSINVKWPPVNNISQPKSKEYVFPHNQNMIFLSNFVNVCWTACWNTGKTMRKAGCLSLATFENCKTNGVLIILLVPKEEFINLFASKQVQMGLKAGWKP